MWARSTVGGEQRRGVAEEKRRRRGVVVQGVVAGGEGRGDAAEKAEAMREESEPPVVGAICLYRNDL
jgi:hypothetical protein